MKKFFILLSVCMLSFTATSCKFIRFNGEDEVLISNDKGDTSVRDYTVEEFTELEINIPCEVKYTIGKSSLSIACTDAQAEKLEIRQEGSQLTISSKVNKKKSINLANKKITIYLSSGKLNNLTTNGAVDFEAESGIKADDFHASFNGASDIEIEGLEAKAVSLIINGAADLSVENLACEYVKVSGNGAADCKISGKAQDGEMSVNGAGTIDVRKLDIGHLSSSVNGAGKVLRK